MFINELITWQRLGIFMRRRKKNQFLYPLLFAGMRKNLNIYVLIMEAIYAVSSTLYRS